MCVRHQSNLDLQASFSLGTRLAARSKVISCVICCLVACILLSPKLTSILSYLDDDLSRSMNFKHARNFAYVNMQIPDNGLASFNSLFSAISYYLIQLVQPFYGKTMHVYCMCKIYAHTRQLAWHSIVLKCARDMCSIELFF